MKSIKRRDIRLIYESGDFPHDTSINCPDFPKFILDNQGRLFQKNRTIFNSDRYKTTYSEVSVAILSNIEIAENAIEVTHG